MNPLKRRELGRRRSPALSPFLEHLDPGRANSVLIDAQHTAQLRQLYESEPVLRAIRRILVSQITSGRLRVVRAGTPVPLQPRFAHFLDRHFLPFATAALDELLDELLTRTARGGGR